MCFPLTGDFGQVSQMSVFHLCSIFVFKKEKSSSRILGGVGNMLIHSPATGEKGSTAGLCWAQTGLLALIAALSASGTLLPQRVAALRDRIVFLCYGRV